MYRLSLIIGEIYNKYLPLAEKNNIRLNLDFSDTTKTVSDPEEIKQSLDQHLNSALSRADRSEIKIAVEHDAIVVTDSGTILSRPLCELLSSNRVTVRSRVGFGTVVRISLAPSEQPKTPAQKSSQPKTPAKKLTPPKSKTKKS